MLESNKTKHLATNREKFDVTKISPSFGFWSKSFYLRGPKDWGKGSEKITIIPVSEV